MTSIPPDEPVGPQPPHMAPPPLAAQAPQAPPPPHQPVAPYMVPTRGPSDAPSPLGIGIAAVGLLLLCVSVLVPRITLDVEGEDEFAFYGISSFYGQDTFGIDTTTVVLTVALLAAVGMSAHRSAGLRWPARLSAIGIAALTAAYAYHPVTVLQQTYDLYEDSDNSVQVDIAADSGVYLAVFAAAMLAASTFFMQLRRPQPYYAAPPPPAPAAGPGTDPTITVGPG